MSLVDRVVSGAVTLAALNWSGGRGLVALEAFLKKALHQCMLRWLRPSWGRSPPRNVYAVFVGHLQLNKLER